MEKSLINLRFISLTKFQIGIKIAMASLKVTSNDVRRPLKMVTKDRYPKVVWLRVARKMRGASSRESYMFCFSQIRSNTTRARHSFFHFPSQRAKTGG